MSNFVHLHLHSEYSLLMSSCRISEIPKIAKQHGQSAVAITDSTAMYGVIPFYKACLNEGIKPIIGCEIKYFKETHLKRQLYKLVLLCKNTVGYQNLVKIVSTSSNVDFNILKSHSAGLFAICGGLDSEISQKIISGDISAAGESLDLLKSIFGNSLYIELQNHNTDIEKSTNDSLVSLSNEYNVPLVATNDVHYLNKSDCFAHKILTKISDGVSENINKHHIFDTNEHYFKNGNEMSLLFQNYPEAISNTSKIADACNLTFDFGQTKIPVYKCPDGLLEDDYLLKLTEESFLEKINSGVLSFDIHSKDEYKSRYEYELSVIKKMGYSGYFLIVWDFVNYAKSKDIPVGPGRGSGAGSLVAYLIGITDVDPLHYDLLFERFLNPERVSMPDFDIDFGDLRRNEVIDYVKNKYGEEHTSQIITFGTLAAKAVIRDVGKALELPQDTIDSVADLIPREFNVTLKVALQDFKLKKLYEESNDVKQLIDVSLKLEGLPRHVSVHAAGVVITENPVSEYVPITKSGDVTITQYDMTSVLDLGLLKFDFLAIRYLTVLKNAEDEIKKSNPSFSLNSVPLNDKTTYELIASGNTDGVFQLESQGMKNTLVKLMPETLEDIIAAIALYRPGPMSSIPKYIDSRHGIIKPEYPTPLLAPILDSTYGCIVYQEQVMQIFCKLAGYSLGHADIVRRAISKKHADELLREKNSFIQGAVSNGLSEIDAEKLFTDIEDFADYAFNKSHAAAYSVLSYRTAYLKTHYKAEFYCALMTSVISSVDKISEYVSVIKKEGIAILPPNVNESYSGFTTSDSRILFGLGSIKNLGLAICDTIVLERESNGKFKDFQDFIRRLSSKGMNKRQAEALIKSGALDSLGSKRSIMLSNYDKLFEPVKNDNQLDLFSSSGVNVSSSIEFEDIDELSNSEKLKLEYEYLGIYLSGSLFDDYKKTIANIKQDNFKQEQSKLFSNKASNLSLNLCAVIVSIKRKLDKNNNPMAFVTLELTDGTQIETVAFSSVMEAFPPEDSVVRLTLFCSVRAGRFTSQIKEIELLEKDNCEKIISVPKLYIKHNGDNLSLAKFYALVDVAVGDTEIVLYNSKTKKALKLVGKRIVINNFTLSELYKLFGKDSVIVK